jgi:short-subunit dehydrogenase
VDFKQRYGPWALVAGASEGIGEAWCRRLAQRGLNLVLVARREPLLRAAAAEIERRFGVETAVLALDLASADLIERVAGATQHLDVGFVVYNAAHSEIGEFVHQSIESKLLSIDVNCRALVLLTSFFAERLIARGRGAMVLMSSMSGWQGTAMLSTYAASKAFITVLGEGLWSELRPLGVDVHVCVAGATLTPGFRAQTPLDKQRRSFPMTPEAVVDAMLPRLGGGPIVIAGRLNRVVYALLGRLIPRSAAVRFFSRTLRDMYGRPR